MLDNNSVVCYTIARKLAGEPAFSALYEEQPFHASLLLEKFKEFLDSDKFVAVERQLILYTTLTVQPNKELVRELINFCNECKNKDDYRRVVMEWTFHHSERITNEILSALDADELSYDKSSMHHSSLLARTKSVTSNEIFNILNNINPLEKRDE